MKSAQRLDVQDIAATASDGPHKPNQRCVVAEICLEATDLKANAVIAERRSGIDPKIDPKLVGAIALS